MDTRTTHYVDIHEAVNEDEEEEEKINDDDRGTKMKSIGDFKAKNHLNRDQTKIWDSTRQNTRGGFSRQVSLETGFSKLHNGESRTSKNDERIKLTRSGHSLGGLGSTHNFATNINKKKGDFNMFRTKSSLIRQSSKLHLMRKESGINIPKNDASRNVNDETIQESVPAGRYFAALRGPELDEIKDYEDILLPKDEKWPFLLRFPIGCFGICLGLSSQAILWKSIATSPSLKFLHITPFINFSLWLLALGVLIAVSLTYLFKCALYFEAVRREFFHPIRVNFFFAPWIVCMFLAIGVPPRLAPQTLHPSILCAFMAPILFLDLKIYGQWLSGGKRRLCKVANPSSHLSVVGNFVGAILAARVDWKEAGKFLWAIGFAHYLVVFVTLYQRLPTSEALPKELHPVYSMFIATPAAASIAWEAIYGDFDGLSRTCYFIALFLFSSLVVRINFFRGFRFSVAWWSYTFPMTTLAIVTIKYEEQVPSVVTKVFALTLAFMSSAMVTVLFMSTLLHAFVWRTLFPNDLAIAIRKRRHFKEKKPFKKTYDIKRWTKHNPLSLIKKQNPAENEYEGEN